MATVFKRDGRPNFYAEYTDASGRRVRKSTQTTRRRDAQAIANRWEAESLAIRTGTGTRDATLDHLMDEYLEYLTGKSPKHRQATRQRLHAIWDHAEWTRPQQISQLGVETAVRQIVHPKTGRPIALRTQSHYLAAAKSFTRWLVQVRKFLASDPLSAVRKPRFQHDRRLTRRFLMPDEWQWLAKTPHAVLYQTAIQTGFRASELAALTPASLGQDHLFLPANRTKNKQDATQYITAGLRDRLASSLPFPISTSARLAELLRFDLGVARWLAANDGHAITPGFLAPVDERGHVLDFHSLRHTCGAWLALRGTNPKVIQRVMRHSSIALTLDTYGHLLPGAERDAIQVFGDMLGQ